MKPITFADYAGAYVEHPDFTEERRANASATVTVANRALELAEADGIVLHINPKTGTHIAGSGNGGLRPQDDLVGAKGSEHKEGRAIDIYDPFREFTRWCLRNSARLKELGIFALEDPRWTPSWAHLQIRAVPSGRWVFVPSREAPIAAALPEQDEGLA